MTTKWLRYFTLHESIRCIGFTFHVALPKTQTILTRYFPSSTLHLIPLLVHLVYQVRSIVVVLLPCRMMLYVDGRFFC